MQGECGIDYHNTGYLMANGHQITADGEPGRLRRDRSPHLMGPLGQPKTEFVLLEGQMIVYTEDRRADIWIEQCTYRHLLEVLGSGVPDPPVVLVQGFVGRGPEGAVGALMPVYEFDAVEDLPPGGRGEFAIVLRDGSGEVLSRHPWDPVWRVPDLEIERDGLAFAFRLRRPEALARIELEGPEGILDVRELSASRPQVAIRSPRPDETIRVEGNAVPVEWTGTDADGDRLVYTVFYSADRGETWMDVAFETAETSVLVPIDLEAPADAHRILVRVTDGGRSADAVRTLQLDSGGP
jgi:hypothetical protein